MSVTTMFGVQVRVRVALGADPDSDSSAWAWTDVTDKVLAAGDITISRGRSSDLNTTIDPMSCAFSVDNTAGDFTPGNRGGAYWPYMRKNLPVQVQVFNTTLSVWITRFQGFVESLPSQFPTGKDSGFVSAAVTAYGRWRRVGQRGTLRSYVTEAITILGPYGYWPLTDSSGLSDASGNGLPDASAPTWAGFTFEYPDANVDGFSGKPPGIQPDKLAVPDSVEALVQLPGITVSSTDGTAVAFVVGSSTKPTVDVTYIRLLDTTETVWTVAFDQASGLVRLSRSATVVASANWTAGSVYVIRWQYVSVGTVNVTVNFGTTAPYSGVVPSFVQANIAYDAGGVYEWEGFGHVAVWARALTSVEAQALLLAMWYVTPTFVDRDGTAALKQTGEIIGYPEPDLLIENLDQQMGPYPLGGKSPTQAVQDIAAAEPGVVFEGLEGELVHHAYSRRLGASAWLALDMDDADVMLGVTLEYDDRDLANDVSVQAANLSARVIDQDSVDDVGAYQRAVTSPGFYTLDPPLSTDLRPADYASALVQLHGKDTVRLAGLRVDLRTNTGLRDLWLRRQIRNRAYYATEVSIAGMSAVTNCSVARDTSGKAFSGTGSAKVTVTASGVWTIEQIGDQPAQAGQVWVATFYARANSTARSLTPTLRPYNAAGTLLTPISGSAASDTSAGVTRYTVTGTMPAGTASVRIGCNGASSAAGEIHFISNRQLELGSTASPYIDGTSTGSMWLGGFFPEDGQSYQKADPLGELVTIANPPAQMGMDSVGLFVEGYTEVIGVDKWQAGLNFSSAGNMPYLFMLEDAIAGHLDCDGQTVNTLANAGATTVSIATAAGKPLLSTTAGDYPIDLRIDGRKIRATACSGASSPQTLTVSALTTSLPAGASVELWQPYVLTY